MHSSKLFTLLGGLNTAEFRWLQKFLKSPYYNSNEQVFKLFKYIKKYYPDLDSPKLSKEVTHKYLFPKQKFTPQRIRKLMHELATLVEDFMVAQHVQMHQFERKKILTKELGHRNLYSLFEKNSTEIGEELNKLPYRDKDYFLEQYLNQYQLLAHQMTSRQKGVIERLLPLSNALDNFYFLQKLQLNCDLESAKNIYQIEAKLPFFEEIEAEIKQRGFGESATLNLYFLINQLFQQQDSKERFDKLYQSFLKLHNKIGEVDKELILKYLINFASKQINKGDSLYVKIGLDLYKIGLANNLLIKNGKMTENTFTNIVWFGCFLDEFDFVKEFISYYKQFLDEKRQAGLTVLCYANLCFKTKQYSETIKLLSTTSFSNHLYKLRSKTLLIKAYFELYLSDKSYYSLLTTQIDNFERNIHRETKISPNKKIGYLNFSKFLKKLLDLKLKKFDLIALKNNLMATESVSHKPWLLEKLN